jgi:D-alanyl-D-alanine carboxypeptidase
MTLGFRSAFGLAGVVLMAAAGPGNTPAGGTGIPDTPLGRRVSAYVSTFNSGDEKAMIGFWTANFTEESLRERPVDARLPFYRRMRADFKTIEPATVEESSATAFAFLAKSPDGEWVRLRFEAEGTPPYRLSSMRVETVDAPAAKKEGPAEPPKASDAQAAAAADEFLRGLASQDEFSGAVLLARDNTPFLEKAYGLAEREFKVSVNLETRFNLGSINKIFTKTAIAQLAAAGRLSLSDTIRKHLPRYGAPYADRVTILQLLNFSSGMGDIFGAKWDAAPKESLRTLADYLPLFENDPLKFEPGTNHAYSNAGYVVLGLIIEAVSGQDYYAYVRENIFRPAAMADSDSYASDDIVENRAVGYTKEGGRWHSNAFQRPARGSSAGGGYSTVRDLLKFGAALKAGKLVSPAYSSWILSRGEGPPETAAPPGRVSGSLGIAGGSPGVNAALLIDADRGYTVVVLCNGDPPAAEKALKKIRGLLPSRRSALRVDHGGPIGSVSAFDSGHREFSEGSGITLAARVVS